MNYVKGEKNYMIIFGKIRLDRRAMASSTAKEGMG